MKLSIVIVNYNVKYFLEQCLHSVRKAIKNMDAEVFVVDNASVDHSCDMVKERFPEVKLIENKKNTGFSVANNQAIKESSGEYVLLLNPDTVVEEDTFSKCLAFMDQHQDAGALGVKMIDGKGHFLPESKRALPSPWVAFYKIFGLSMLFPKSKKFGRYHLGNLDKNKNHEVEILAGAFMMMRKKALDKVGLLDETFFMYGEDIDLSYRIIQGGYKNYYFSDTRIIHYKGESTKKSSVNYVLVFYQAMIIFARKHFSKKNARLFSFFIKMAVYFRAGLSILQRFVMNSFYPLLDAVVIFAGYLLITPIWEVYKFGEQGAYPESFMMYAVPAYILIYLAGIFFSGGYDKPIKLIKLNQGVLAGFIIILLGYSVLSEDLRFSRAMIFLGGAWTVLSLNISRLLLHLSKKAFFKIDFGNKKRIVIVGRINEAKRVFNLLKKTVNNPLLIGYIGITENPKEKEYLGSVNQLKDITSFNKINEIIFCAKDLDSGNIINYMLELSGENIDFKIAPPESLSIIGSNSINTAGDLYVIPINSISNAANKRKKRLFDIFSSLIVILFLPFSLVVHIKKLPGLFKNTFSVLIGLKSWVGFYSTQDEHTLDLPKIKKGILSPVVSYKNIHITREMIQKMNIMYAKDYRVWNDIRIFFRGFRNIAG